MKSLYAILGELPFAALQELAPWWGAEPPEHDDVDARQRLERAMRDSVASRFVWERLDDDERRVLFLAGSKQGGDASHQRRTLAKSQASPVGLGHDSPRQD